MIACPLFITKLLLEPLLTHCQLDLKQQIFQWNVIRNFHSGKYIWRCHQQNDSHCVWPWCVTDNLRFYLWFKSSTLYIQIKIQLRHVSEGTINYESSLAWCQQATSHHLSQWVSERVIKFNGLFGHSGHQGPYGHLSQWGLFNLRSTIPYDIIGPQWVNLRVEWNICHLYYKTSNYIWRLRS